jgi:hypothetical protein
MDYQTKQSQYGASDDSPSFDFGVFGAPFEEADFEAGFMA